jgi:hypothetical protein
LADPGRRSSTGSKLIETFSVAGAATPVPGGENARMNLWLFQGHAPPDGREVEVIVSKFEFVAPAP